MTETRICNKCKNEKSIADFYEGTPTICRECRNAYRRIWRKNNPGKDASSAKRYRERNVEKVRLTRKKYAENNPETMRRAQMTRDKNKHAETKRRRRRRKLKAEGSFSQKEFLWLCSAFDNKCLRCGQKFDIGGQYGLVPDHIVPLSEGGSDYIFNIQVLCGKCNRKKHTKVKDYRPFIPNFVNERENEIIDVKRTGSAR